jgi:hypothetical protein
MYETAVKAAEKRGGGGLGDFVLNTYLSLHDPFSPGQICGN